MSDRSAINVRRALLSDIGTLRRFEQGIIAAERPYDPTIRKDPVQYYDLEALIASNEAFVAIAEGGGAPVGCGLAYRKTSAAYTEPAFHAYVGLMFVEPQWRGMGVSRAVTARLFDWAKSQGLVEIRLEVYPENSSALRAYEKTGFFPYMLEMRTRLPGD